MRRRLAAPLAAVLAVSGLSVFATARPAAAIWVCPGLGTFQTGNPVYYPGFGSTSQNSFVFTFGIGACVHIPSGTTTKTITATGVFLGYCGFSSGAGTTGNGDLFAFVGVGGVLVVTGHTVGTLTIAPDVLNGESCTTGADRFLIAGVLILLNCPADLGPGRYADTETLVTSFMGEFHFWTNGPCVPDPLVL